MITINNYNRIPQELKALANWVLFKKVKRINKNTGEIAFTKQPYQTNGELASVTNASTWNSFTKVYNKLTSSKYDGIGFVFTDSPIMGIDIDHCIKDGKLSPVAVEILETVNSYAEYSPSGEGIHILLKGDLNIKGARNTKLGIELYTTGRYFTVTGNTIAGYETISNDLTGFKAVYNKFMAKDNHKEDKAKRPAPQPPKNYIAIGDIETIIDNIRRSKQSALFTKLFDRGDISDYNGDESAADMALMNILPFWTGGDIQKMLAVFNLSALAGREKWQKRQDYQSMTIAKALKDWNGKTYDPNELRNNQLKQDKFLKQNKINKSADEIKQLAYFNQSDTGNAERLLYIYPDTIKHCTASDRWMIWDGMRWKLNDSKDATELYNIVSSIMRLSAKQYDLAFGVPTNKKQEHKKQAYLAFFKRSENQASIINTIKRARAFYPVDINKLDANPWLLNCTNGTVDLKTGLLQAHNKDDLITKVCATKYIAGAKSELWEHTINTIIPNKEVQRYIQKFIGYSLTGLTREEKFLFLYGEGGGGKGTFIETIGKILGDYADTIPIDILLTARNDAGTGNEPAPQIAKMAGKRLILTSESGRGRKFNDAKIKLLTGGDRITARFLRCEPFTFTPTCKFIMSSNFLPAVTDTTDKGIKRRLIIVPFNANLDDVRDIELKDKLLLPQNKEGILNWCIQGCLLWQREGLGKMPHELQKTMVDYYDENDLIGEFINTCCDIDTSERVKVKDLLRAFNTWADDGSRWHGMRMGTFKDDLKRRGFQIKRYNNGLHFLGLSILNTDDFLNS